MSTDTIVEQVRPASELKVLHETQKSLEKFRIQFGNRVSALSRGVDVAAKPVPVEYQLLATKAEEMEALLDTLIMREVESYAVWKAWLMHVKGIGPGLAGQMLALLLPPIPTKGPSSWYRAAGLYAEEVDGVMHLPRARAGGGKITYHPWLRRCLHNVGTSFVRNGGYYRGVYEDRKARLQRQHEGDTEWAAWRIDSVARWITVKLFLSHLWEAWCDVESITNRQAWITVHGGGEHHYIPRPLPNGKGKI